MKYRHLFISPFPPQVMKYHVVDRCHHFTRNFWIKKKGLGLERAKDCCSANALEKKLPDIRKATGRGGGIESIDKGLEDNWWGGGGGFIHTFVINTGLNLLW